MSVSACPEDRVKSEFLTVVRNGQLSSHPGSSSTAHCCHPELMDVSRIRRALNYGPFSAHAPSLCLQFCGLVHTVTPVFQPCFCVTTPGGPSLNSLWVDYPYSPLPHALPSPFIVHPIRGLIVYGLPPPVSCKLHEDRRTLYVSFTAGWPCLSERLLRSPLAYYRPSF